MARLPIIVAPDIRLKAKTVAVDQVDADVRQLMSDMLETMHAANGIGLAAPQVGIKLRVLVMDISADEDPANPICMANPEIIWASDALHDHEEGCLSLPEQFAEVTRPNAVRVRYLDNDNEIREMDAEGLLAVCVQHEIDHLDGKLFVDHISGLKRNMIIRRLQKSRRGQSATV